MKTTIIGDHAVVLGASMAGLLTARVLTDAYDRVTWSSETTCRSTWATAGGYCKAFTSMPCTPGAGRCSTSCFPASPSR